jgi:predicted DCC family thiol-disulfide oxidoreductase YuxK
VFGIIFAQMNTTSPPVEGPVVVYDGECPFCAAYVRMTRLRESAGPVTLVDARTGEHPVLGRIRERGLDLDRGMVVELDGQLHHGDAAMTALALLTTPSGAFNRAMRAVFRRPGLARVIYPPMVAGRNLTLRLLGRRPIGAR